MMLNNNTSKVYQLYKLLFQIVFWCMWILLPVSMFYYVLGHQGIPWKLIFSCALLIPLFYLNCSFLIPNVFEKKGIGKYILSLILVVLVFYLMSVFIEFKIGPGTIDAISNPNNIDGMPHPSQGRGIRGELSSFRAWTKPLLPLAFIVLISTVYGLIDYFVREEQKKKDEKKERMESELSFLRSQVSPHFLLNTLNSVLYLVRTKSDKAEELVLKLSDIIKYMIYDCNNNEVPLNSEVQYLKNYIELQTVRFGQDVKIVYQCEGDFTPYMIEPMLMVPYVENAFKHGTAAISDPEINVVISMEANVLKLDVKNKYQKVIERQEATGGIGLENVKRRLELLYPNSHKLEQGIEKDWYVVHLELKLNRE